MISSHTYLELVDKHLGYQLFDQANRAQLDAVIHDADRILQIVAGPGSGKTTVLVLRALRFVFVKDILPENILITTFTRKAARELRTRWLDWGTKLCSKLKNTYNLDHIDLNRCRIDTLDSIIYDVLREFRPPGTLAPMVADTSASILILKRGAFQTMYWNNKAIVDPLLARYTFTKMPPRNQGEALNTTKRLLERLVQDRVRLYSYAQTGPGEAIIVKMLEQYKQEAIQTNVFDFTTLEEQFLRRLSKGQLNDWTGDLRVILIDEYQDTNPLQEAIYFSMIRSSAPSVTIVGDDDQSMYRFRGGSVELFTGFADRCRRATGHQTNRVNMVRNFRSRPEIVNFFNDHIGNDSAFQNARIEEKQRRQFIFSTHNANIPVLGMFRGDQTSLARDLTLFLKNLIDRRRILVGNTGQEICLSAQGALGDAVFLAHSVREVSYNRYNDAPQERFPSILRTALNEENLEVFNPRGRALRSIPDVQRLLGLMLISADPHEQIILNEIHPTNEVRYFLNQWRRKAQRFVNSNPFPDDGRGLNGFVEDWQSVASGAVDSDFPLEWPVLDLVYKLISWMPSFQREPEHHVWLEAIMRIIGSAGIASPYGMKLIQNVATSNQGAHVERSRTSLIRDALVPIAADEVQVDEDIMSSVPRDRLQLMTIHQAKGLEFPLVIVDVGSNFSGDRHLQRFLRFPDTHSGVVQAENDMEPHLSDSLRANRGANDRTFDDLVRLYYVAYSRPQSVLLLVGHEKCLSYGRGRNHSTGVVPNIALGWRRDRHWPWRQSYTNRKPPVKVNPPFWEL